MGWACLDSAMQGRTEHRPTSLDYPDSIVKRITFTAGGGLGWRLSALTSPRERPTAWKVVVITGAPSWAEYWAPVLAAAPEDWEMVVVDRPGFGASEPADCVPDLKVQVRALAPILTTRPGQKLLILGQSYGAAIAALLAVRRPQRLAGVVLLSSYVSSQGPTTRWLMKAAATPLFDVLPRDLRHAVEEIRGQPGQIALLSEALDQIDAPIHVIHGDRDDFAPVESALAFFEAATRKPVRIERIAMGDHFLNDGPADRMIDLITACLPTAKARAAWKLPDWRAVGATLARLTGAGHVRPTLPGGMTGAA